MMTTKSITVMSAIAVAVLAAGGVLVSCDHDDLPVAVPPGPQASVPAEPSPSPSPSPVPFPPAGKVFLGVQTNLGPYDFGAVDAFAEATGHRPSVLQFSQGWAE